MLVCVSLHDVEVVHACGSQNLGAVLARDGGVAALIGDGSINICELVDADEVDVECRCEADVVERDLCIVVNDLCCPLVRADCAAVRCVDGDGHVHLSVVGEQSPVAREVFGTPTVQHPLNIAVIAAPF